LSAKLSLLAKAGGVGHDGHVKTMEVVMRTLTMNEIEFVSGAAPGNEITKQEAAGLANYYAALGGGLALVGMEPAALLCLGLAAGFSLYSIM
jgi:hypothetical protein